MHRFLLVMAIVLLGAHAQAAEAVKPSAKANLTILADDTLLLPLAQLARAYATDAQTPLTIVVKNAEDAQHQIEQGLEAHVIMTANAPLLTRLAEQGLTDVSSRTAIARTQLALVTASDLGKQANIARRISFASMLAATPNMPVLVNDATSMEGAMAQALCTGYAFSPALASRLSTRPTHEEVIASLRDEPSLGLMLATEAVAEPDLRVVSLLTEDISPSVTFSAVVLGSESMAEAKEFVDYLTTRKAQAMLTHFGYQPIP